MTDHYHTAVEAAENEPHIGYYEYLYVLMLIFYAGRSIIFFELPSLTENTLGVLLPVIMSGILAFKWRLFFTKEFYLLLFFFALYFVAVSVKYYEIQPTFIILYYMGFFTAFTAIKVLKFNIFTIYEKILYFLAGISLVLWGLQVVAGGDFLFNIFARSSYLRSISFVSGDGISTLFYSIQPYSTTIINNHTISRNCGFAWEPGSYGSYLSLGLFINLFIARDEKRKKRFWVLLMALLSTMSTTAYVLLTVIMIFYFINRDFKIIMMLFPVVVVALILFFSLPFMKDKIIELLTETETVEQIISDSVGREVNTTPQRFTSFLITFIDFRNNPVLGLAAHSEDSWTRMVGSSISPITGIGTLLSQFGLVGFIPFIFFSIKTSFKFAKHFNYRGKWLLFIAIILISVSYTIIFIPFIMCFWLYSLFEPDLALEGSREVAKEVGA
jgi:hypothetical protein